MCVSVLGHSVSFPFNRKSFSQFDSFLEHLPLSNSLSRVTIGNLREFPEDKFRGRRAEQS